jgi:hypothetical protein
MAVDSVTGRPMKGVHLKLFTPNISGEITESYGAMSDSDGRFSVTGMPPGVYLIFAERTGFVHMVTPTGVIPLNSITLKSGERVSDFRLEMTPRAVIVARVVDEYGDPVPNATVEASPTAPGGPIAAAISPSNRVMTNLLGEARVTGGPGSFHVKATPAVAASRASDIGADNSRDPSYGPTWYPSAISAASASAVEIKAGADLAIEIRLVRQRSITITGAVSGIPADSSAYVTLLSGDRADRLINTQTVNVGPDGAFAFAKLPPAYYRVTAYTTAAGRPKFQSQSVEVSPVGPEQINAQLQLTAGTEVAGSLEMAGDPPRTPTERTTVTVGPSSATSEADGSFRIGGIFRGRYRLSVQPLPANGYVKTVELDGVATSEPEVDFSRVTQGSRLKITLARDGAELSGRVLDKNGQPLGDTLAIVILAPDLDRIQFDQNGLVKAGKYSLKGIRPGKYLLFAIDAFRSGPANSPEDLRRLAAAAEKIEIKPGDRIVKDIKLLLKEDVDARTKK